MIAGPVVRHVVAALDLRPEDQPQPGTEDHVLQQPVEQPMSFRQLRLPPTRPATFLRGDATTSRLRSAYAMPQRTTGRGSARVTIGGTARGRTLAPVEEGIVVSAGGARRGRRDNGLDAADFAVAGDVDPRVGEHILDVLGAGGIAAYLQPSSDLNPVTRTTTVPPRPVDRLYVDSAHLETARGYLAKLGSEDEPPPRTNGHDPDVEAAWAKIVAGWDKEPARRDLAGVGKSAHGRDRRHPRRPRATRPARSTSSRPRHRPRHRPAARRPPTSPGSRSAPAPTTARACSTASTPSATTYPASRPTTRATPRRPRRHSPASRNTRWPASWASSWDFCSSCSRAWSRSTARSSRSSPSSPSSPASSPWSHDYATAAKTRIYDPDQGAKV